MNHLREYWPHYLVTAVLFAVVTLVIMAGSSGATVRDDSTGQEWVKVGHNAYLLEVTSPATGVPCVLATTSNGAGISCDWGAR